MAYNFVCFAAGDNKSQQAATKIEPVACGNKLNMILTLK